MKNIIVIATAETPRNFYGDKLALLKRESKYEPYVVAQGFVPDGENEGHWGQGSYFEDLPAAMYWFSQYAGYVPPRERKISYDRMSEIADRFKMELENELAYSDHSLYEVATSSEFDIEMTAEELEYFEIYPSEDELDDEDDEDDDEFLSRMSDIESLDWDLGI